MESIEQEAFVPHRRAAASFAVDRVVDDGQRARLPDGVEPEPDAGKLAEQLHLVLLDGSAPFELAASVNGDHGVLGVEARVALGVARVDGVQRSSEGGDLSVGHLASSSPRLAGRRR